MPRYNRAALDKSPLGHTMCSGNLPVVESANRFTALAGKKPVNELLQSVLDNVPPIILSNAERNYIEMVEQTMCDIARALGVQLQHIERKSKP